MPHKWDTAKPAILAQRISDLQEEFDARRRIVGTAGRRARPWAVRAVIEPAAEVTGCAFASGATSRFRPRTRTGRWSSRCREPASPVGAQCGRPRCLDVLESRRRVTRTPRCGSRSEAMPPIPMQRLGGGGLPCAAASSQPSSESARSTCQPSPGISSPCVHLAAIKRDHSARARARLKKVSPAAVRPTASARAPATSARLRPGWCRCSRRADRPRRWRTGRSCR